MLDLAQMSASFGKVRGQTGYDFRADIDWDNSNSILDQSREAAYFGLPCPGQQTRYLYDGNGALLKRTNINTSTLPSTSSWTIYAGGIFEKSFSSVTGATGATDYYAAYGRTIAVRQTPATGTMTLSYLLADQLGSTVGAVDAGGAWVGVQSYYPYGATRSASGALATDKLYTGQQQEATTTLATPYQDATDALGTYFYHARFRGTVTGRFLSADSITTDGLNRFSYVRNSPTNYTDPSGYGVTFGGDPGEGACPATNPDCANSGPGPVGGSHPPCDVACARGVEAICAGNPGAAGCGGGGGRDPAAPGPIPVGTTAPVATSLCGTGSGTCAKPSNQGGTCGLCSIGHAGGDVVHETARAVGERLRSAAESCPSHIVQIGVDLYRLTPVIGDAIVIGVAIAAAPEVSVPVILVASAEGVAFGGTMAETGGPLFDDPASNFADLGNDLGEGC